MRQIEKRIDKDNYYLDIAETVSERSTCLRMKYGAVIVKNDEIISTGYNGAPRGFLNCCDIGGCIRKEKCIPHGERYELCRSVHAEANAIISAKREDMIGATLYLAGKDTETNEEIPLPTCCPMCKRLVTNAGIEKVVTRGALSGIEKTMVRDWAFKENSYLARYL